MNNHNIKIINVLNKYCDCSECKLEIPNIVSYGYKENASTQKEKNKNRTIIRAIKCKNKNKYYFCEKRMSLIFELIYDFAKENNIKKILIVVPEQYSVIKKISEKLINKSMNKLKYVEGILKYLNVEIHLHPIASCNVLFFKLHKFDVIFINAFYYHMYLISTYHCNLKTVFLNCNDASLIIMNDDIEIFKKECEYLNILLNN